MGKTLCGLIKIRYSIFQAPMNGITTPKLVAAVSNAGGLSNLATGYVSTEGTREMI